MTSVLAKLVRTMWVPTLLSVFYAGWVFWQRRIPDRAPKDHGSWSTNPLAAYGNSVKILQFYTDAREIAPHEKSLVCYGVVNAAAVRLDPPVARVWPAVSRCFEVTPAKSTRYTLTAEDPKHTTVSESFEIKVRGR